MSNSGSKDEPWLPLRDAVFAAVPAARHHFFERFLVGGTHASSPPLDERMRFNPARPELRSLDGRDLLFCEIDWTRQLFVYRWALDRNSMKGTIGLSGQPWEYSYGLCPDFLSDRAWKMIQNGAALTLQLTLSLLNNNINEHCLFVRAKPNTLSEHFLSVPAEA